MNKKVTLSVLALLLAVFTVLSVPAEAGCTFFPTTSDRDAGYCWTSTLPRDGDKAYQTEGSWYRLVLTFGNSSQYCTNSTDSNGNYSTVAPVSCSTSSWPSQPFYDYTLASKYATKSTDIWPGTYPTFKTANLVSEGDAALYANGEYTVDTFYSLYIKYAGKSAKTGEDCWYISPCGSDGMRQDRLWALDCHLNTTYLPESTRSLSPYHGLYPDFNLLMPTFSEFEAGMSFRYAGVTYDRTAKSTYGVLLGNYIDNEKWIIRETEDGSWSIQSAGYITWDYTKDNDLFAWELGTPEEVLKKAYEEYCQYLALMQDSESVYHQYLLVARDYYSEGWYYYITMNELSLVGMLYLSEYAEHVYLTACAQEKLLTFDLTNTIAYSTEGVSDLFSSDTVENVPGGIRPSYHLLISTELTQAQRNSAQREEGYTLLYEQRLSDIRGADGKLLFDDELRAAGVIRYRDTFSANSSNSFTGLYVAVPLKKDYLNKDHTKRTIDDGTTVTLGRPDSNGDGIMDGIGFIGDMDYYVTNDTTVNIKRGGVLQIDGPTFVAPSQNILVKGTLVINAGGYLAPYDRRGFRQRHGYDAGFTIKVDGGSVIIANGGALYTGRGTISITGDGLIINSGLLVMDTYSSDNTRAILKMAGGTMEINPTGWTVIGAEVYRDQIGQLISGVGTAEARSNINSILPYLSGMTDAMILNQSEYPSGYADVIFASASGDERNLFRNMGNCFLMGAVKSVSGGRHRSIMMGTDTIHRLMDAYADTSSSGKTLRNSDTSVLERYYATYDEELYGLITSYYDFTGIDLTDSPIYEDDGADTEAKRENVYALRVGTGSQGTGNIDNFIITYQGTDGKEHTSYVSPSSLDNTYSFARSWKYCGSSETQRGDSALKRNTDVGTGAARYLKELRTDALSGSASYSGKLDPMTDRVYLFQTLYPISYIKSISFSGSGSSSWTCTCLNVYRVSYLYPLEEYGYASRDWYVPFSGTLIAETDLPVTSNSIPYLNFSWDSEIVSIGTGSYKLKVYTADSGAKTQTDRSGFTYYDVSSSIPSYTSVTNDYTFVVTLADTDGAGIESLYSRNTISSLSRGILPDACNYADLLKMKLTYVATDGVPRSVEIPVSLNTLMWSWDTIQQEHSSQTTAPLHGLFQQGEELVFRGKLPNFDHAIEATLSYNDNMTEGGTISVAGISIHSAYYSSVSVKRGMLKADYPVTPVSYYAASSIGGTIISNGQSMSVAMKNWSSGESLLPKERGNRYLVVVQTDEMSEASTVNDVYVSFTYENLQNVTQDTETFSLRRKVNDYFGYWVASDGTENCGYQVAMTAGQQLFFVIEPTGAFKFLSATFTMDDNSVQDEWQMAGITIYELEELGPREVSLGNGIHADTISTDRLYYRDNSYASRGALCSASGSLMIGPGESKTISFTEGGKEISGGGVSDHNKATNVKSLTYEETLGNFGFDKKRVKYTVNVQVAGDPITSAADGDCGSKNQFYFQLVFQDEDSHITKSSYVLSNQQLQGDGFRTGTMESFAIYANDDYGDPIQVNIIPDDTSSASDVFDKLKIDSISVCKTSSAGVNLSWKTEMVGWIDIDYRDDSETSGGRTAEQLTKSFALKQSGYTVLLEFGIETGPDYCDGKQFVGQMTADITFRDGSDRIRTMSDVDVVAQIADYANVTNQLGKTPAGGTQISLSDFMFKRGYTNRFQLTFDDIRSLVRIKLKITPEEDMTWCLSNLSVRQVFNDGTLSFNVFDEYERYYSVEPQDLCTVMSNSGTHNISLIGGKPTYVTLNFDAGNAILVDLTEDEENVNVKTGEAPGEKDAVSMIAELKSTVGVSSGASFPATLYYKNIYGDAYKVTSDLVFDSSTHKFIIPKEALPNTAYFGIPCRIELMGTDATDGRDIDKVTVNQIRDGRPIAEYVFSAEDGLAVNNGTTVTLSYTASEQDEYAERRGLTSDEEILYLELSNATEKMLLTNSRDIKAALVYTEKNDPYSYEHTSPFVSVLDSGYASIEGGDVLELPFRISNVGSIQKVLLAVTDSSMKVSESRACIVFHETSNISGDVISSGWVNLPNAGGLIRTEDSSIATDGKDFDKALADKSRLSPIRLGINVPQIGRSDACVKITVHYMDTSDKLQTIIADASAAQWNKEPLWLMTKGLKSILYYELETYDKDSTNLASVTVSGVELGWYGTDAQFVEISNAGEWHLVEGSPVSGSAVNVQLRGIAYYRGNTASTKLEDNMVTPGRTDYATIEGVENTDIIVQAVLDGYDKDLTIRVTEVGTGTVVKTSTYTDNTAAGKQYDLSVFFTVPANPTLKEKTYEVRVSSKSVPDIYASVFYVTVEPARLEGFALFAGSQVLSFRETGDGSNSSGSMTVKSGSTIEFYIREQNAADDLTASGRNATTGSTVSCTFTAKSYSGTTGVWRYYKLDIPKSSVDAVYTYTFRSKSTALQYVLTVNATKQESHVVSSGTVFLELADGSYGELSSARDVEVAVTYISAIDSAARTSSYFSAYNSGCTSLNGGTVLPINVEMNNASGVKSITVRTSASGMSVNVDNADMIIYQDDEATGTSSYSGWINLGGTGSRSVSTSGVTLNSDTSAFSSSNGRLTPMRLIPNITSADQLGTMICTTVYYRTTSGATASVSAERNLAEWPEDGLWVMAKNLGSLLYTEINVYDTDISNDASALIQNLTLSWYAGSTLSSRVIDVGSLIYESGGSYCTMLTDGSISGTITSSDGTVNRSISDGMTVTVPGGSRITVSASLSRLSGKIIATLYDENGTMLGSSSDNDSLTYTVAPEAGRTYTIRVYSELFPNDLSLEFTVVMGEADEVSAEAQPGEGDPEDNEPAVG